MTAAAFASASAAAAATSVKVAVRVRPFSERELKEESKRVVSMEEGRKVLLVNPNSLGSEPRAFTYDYAVGAGSGAIISRGAAIDSVFLVLVIRSQRRQLRKTGQSI